MERVRLIVTKKGTLRRELAEEKEELDITEKISDSQKEIRLYIKQLQQNVSVENTSSQNEAEGGLCEDIVELGPEFEGKSGDSKKRTCRLKQRIKATKKEQLAILNSKLADDMCNMQRASSDIFSKIGQLKETVSELNHQQNIIQTDNNLLKKEKQRLSMDAVAASKKMIKMESELTALSSQNSKINSKLADLCKSKQQVEEELDTASKEKRKVESDFDHLSRDNEVLQAELRQVMEEKTNILADNSALKKETQRLLNDGFTAQDQISQMASELNFLSKQNNTIKSNLIDLSKAKQKLQVELDTGIEGRRTLQLELDHLRKGHQLLQTEILKVTKENTKLKEDIKVIYEEKVRLSDKASSAHNQISKLTSELRNVRAEKTRIEEARDEMRQENEKLSKDIDAAKNSAIESSQEMMKTKSERDEISRKMEEIIAENEKLKTELATLRAEAESNKTQEVSKSSNHSQKEDLSVELLKRSEEVGEETRVNSDAGIVNCSLQMSQLMGEIRVLGVRLARNTDSNIALRIKIGLISVKRLRSEMTTITSGENQKNLFDAPKLNDIDQIRKLVMFSSPIYSLMNVKRGQLGSTQKHDKAVGLSSQQTGAETEEAVQNGSTKIQRPMKHADFQEENLPTDRVDLRAIKRGIEAETTNSKADGKTTQALYSGIFSRADISELTTLMRRIGIQLLRNTELNRVLQIKIGQISEEKLSSGSGVTNMNAKQMCDDKADTGECQVKGKFSKPVWNKRKVRHKSFRDDSKSRGSVRKKNARDGRTGPVRNNKALKPEHIAKKSSVTVHAVGYMNNFNFLKDKMKGMIRIIIKLEDGIDEHLQVAKGSAEFPVMRDVAWHVDVLHSRVKAATTALSSCYIETLPCTEDCQGNEKVISSRLQLDNKTVVKTVEENRGGGIERSKIDSHPCAVHTIGHMDDFNVLTEKMMGMRKSLTKTKIIVSEYRQRVMKGSVELPIIGDISRNVDILLAYLGEASTVMTFFYQNTEKLASTGECNYQKKFPE